MTLVDEAERRRQRRRLGAALRAAGVLIAVFCGLCTANCAGPIALDMAKGKDLQLGGFALTIAAVIGGLPFVIGVLLAVKGHRMTRDPKADA